MFWSLDRVIINLKQLYAIKRQIPTFIQTGCHKCQILGKEKQTNRNVPTATANLPSEANHCSTKTSLLSLPYKGKQGEKVICSPSNSLDKILP